MVWNVPVSLQSTSLEVYVAGESSSPSKGYVTFDSNPEVSISTGTSFVTNIDSGNLIGFYLSVPANTQKVYFRTGDLNKGCHLVAVKSDGKLLVDKSANDKLTKEVPYDTKLTVAGPTDLADMTGAVLMTDGSGAPGPYSQTPYKLVTTDIESVETGYHGTATQYTSYQFAGQGVTIVFSYSQIDDNTWQPTYVSGAMSAKTPIETVNIGSRPTDGTVAKGFVYEFDQPVKPGFVYFGGSDILDTTNQFIVGYNDTYSTNPNDYTWQPVDLREGMPTPGKHPAVFGKTRAKVWCLLRQQKDQIETGNAGSDSTQQLSNGKLRCNSDANPTHLPWRCKHQPRPAVFQRG